MEPCEEVELKGERLHFKRVTGAGPAAGWISIRLPGKDLAVTSLAFRQLSYFLYALASMLELGPQNLSLGRKFHVESDFQV